MDSIGWKMQDLALISQRNLSRKSVATFESSAAHSLLLEMGIPIDKEDLARPPTGSLCGVSYLSKLVTGDLIKE